MAHVDNSPTAAPEGPHGTARASTSHRRASPEEAPPRFIVQGADLAAAKAAVRGTGGEITHELRCIHAVVARLTPARLRWLERHPDARHISPS